MEMTGIEKCACRECLRAYTSSISGDGVIWSLARTFWRSARASRLRTSAGKRYHAAVSPTGAGRQAALRMRSSAAYAARGTAFQLLSFALLCGALFNEGCISARHYTIRRGLSSPSWDNSNTSLRFCVGEGAAVATIHIRREASVLSLLVNGTRACIFGISAA